MTVFNPLRLVLARHRRQLMLRRLSGLADLTLETLSRLEKNGKSPQGSTVARLAHALNWPENFFYTDTLPEIRYKVVSFRIFPA